MLENVFSSVALVDAPLSYRAIVAAPRYRTAYLAGAVRGALTAYDLPDLAAGLAPRKLLIAGARDGAGALANAEMVGADLAVARSAYAAPSQLSIGHEGERDALTAWVR